jgi:TonB-linked SusC/RagA family outer membrane protein
MSRFFNLFVILCVNIGFVSAQTENVAGTVVSADSGEPIVGASVVVKGATNIGTVTDTNGRFSLNIPSNATMLVVSFIGMIKQEVTVSPNVRIVLVTDLQQLDEVVVIGYGTQAARSVTSAISTVRAEVIRDIPNISIDQTLQGRATGVQVTTPAGIVGQPPIVRIRGVNSITSGASPLYIVDGIPILTGDLGRSGQANGLADINPSDILSVDILKDAASAALYGSRAANGVILINTKSGNRERTSVTYEGWTGFSSPTHTATVMNAREYVDFKNMTVKNRYGTDEMSLTANYVSPYGNKAFNLMTDSKGKIIDSDWKKTVFQTGITHNHTVSISGGSPKTTYYFSGNYTDQEGMVVGDLYSRFGIKANTAVNATDWLKLGGGANVTTGTTQIVDMSRQGVTLANNGFSRLAMIHAPNIPVYNKDGTPFYSGIGIGYGPNTISSQYANPVQFIQQGNHRSTKVTRMIANFTAEIKIIDGLIVKTLYGKDYVRTEDRRFESPLHGDGALYNGYALGISTLYDQWIWTNTLNYAFDVENHNFNLLAGMEANENNWSSWGITRSNLTDLKYTNLQGTFTTNSATGMNLTSNALVSYFSRINYDYGGKYLLSLNFRRDGYSALGDNCRWGNFGGISAGWVVSDETFFSSMLKVISSLKIKGSWGMVGNTKINDYASKSYYNPDYYGNNSIYWLGHAGDPNLKWETSVKWNFGFAAMLFDKVSIDFDYYYTRTNDLIMNVPQAPSKGIPNNRLLTNAGQIENKGFELTFSSDVFRTDDFRWNTSFNLTTNANKVLKLADGVDKIIRGDAYGVETTNITVAGKSIGQLFVAQTRGIDPVTGRRIYETSDGTEILMFFEKGAYHYRNNPSEMYAPVGSGISVSDYRISGNTLPTYFGGWYNSFKYKGFDGTLFFQFSGGNKVLNGTKATLSDMRFWNNALEVKDKHWTPERTHATYAYPIYGDNYSNGSAHPISDWIENGDYLRFKNLIIGYSFKNVSFLNRLGVSSLRVFGQAQNMFTVTGYSGLDPEALANTQDVNLAGGTDKNTMPQAKTVSFGLNITF